MPFGPGGVGISVGGEAYETPLVGRRFFLDVRRVELSARAAAVARAVRRLGATVPPRLDADVTHVIVDEPNRRYAMPHVPVWTLDKVEWFLNEIHRAVRQKIRLGVRALKPHFLKFHSTDGRHRAVCREFDRWPDLNLAPNRRLSPFVPSKRKDDVDLLVSQRMTRKTKPPAKDLQKNNGYCEICRASYSVLSEHERTATHLNFINNCSNFLSLDALINEGTDVETFLKMNRSSVACERRSLRNVVKAASARDARRNPQRRCHAMCNGDARPSSVSPKDCKADRHLRSKAPEPKKNEALRNGSLSPRAVHKLNGRIDDADEPNEIRCSPVPKNARSRSIRWRRPSPDSNPPPVDNRTYYKVVGMSNKLRSSNHASPVVHKQPESVVVPPVPPSNGKLFNGETDSAAGLVVKFRRVRRSELSVLSDEAENFMFPKKDDSDSTEDEVETTRSTNDNQSSELLTTSRSSVNCRVKEEVLSGDDGSRDSSGSDFVKRKTGRRRTRTDSQLKDVQDTDKNEAAPGKRARHSLSKSPDGKSNKSTEANKETKGSDSVIVIQEDSSPNIEKCLRWEDGKLRTSPQIENLSFTFEKVPSYEPWYDAFKRQDEGQENSRDIAQCLGYYWKSPILPYEMGTIPPLKPNCCSLSQYKKVIEPRVGIFPRHYGTRGMKKKFKIEPVPVGRNPRKSPREHASTLAILGSLVNKKRTNKLSSSEDTKSLPSITEEETSSDIPLMFKLPEPQVSESAKKLEEFFSSLVDNEEYDTLVENLDEKIHFERPNGDVVELLQSCDQCDIIEKTIKEMQDNMRRFDGRRRRKGYKFKKKNNRTGWPVKKKNQAKKDNTTSSREASVNGESTTETEELSSARLQDILSSVNVEKTTENSDSSIKMCNKLVTENDNSSISDSDNAVDANIVNWERSGGSLTDVKPSTSSQQHQHSGKDLQPIVRVQKIDTKVSPSSGGGGGFGGRGRRRLRSSGVKRRRGRSAR